MADIYSNGGNRWNILGFNFTERDALSSLYKISMTGPEKRKSSNLPPPGDKLLFKSGPMPVLSPIMSRDRGGGSFN